MSEEKQRRATKRRDNALEREANARRRAEANRRRDDPLLARLHEQSADLQAEAAATSERQRRDDVEIEGDQLAGDDE